MHCVPTSRLWRSAALQRQQLDGLDGGVVYYLYLRADIGRVQEGRHAIRTYREPIVLPEGVETASVLAIRDAAILVQHEQSVKLLWRLLLACALGTFRAYMPERTRDTYLLSIAAQLRAEYNIDVLEGRCIKVVVGSAMYPSPVDLWVCAKSTERLRCIYR